MSSVGLDISKLPAPAKPSTAQPALIKTPFKDLGTRPATPPHILHEFWENLKVNPPTTVSSVSNTDTSSWPLQSSSSSPSNLSLSTTLYSTSPASASPSSKGDVEKYDLREKKGTHGVRSLRFRILDLYRRFFSVVFAVVQANLWVAV